jgi:hypothetical protein
MRAQLKVALFEYSKSGVLCSHNHQRDKMKHAELTRIFLESVTGGTAKALSETNIQTTMVSKAEAYRLYGRSQVDRWICEGLLKPAKGQIHISKSGIDREKLEAIAAASNRGTYLPVTDR